MQTFLPKRHKRILLMSKKPYKVNYNAVPLLRELIDEITVYETEGVGKNRS